MFIFYARYCSPPLSVPRNKLVIIPNYITENKFLIADQKDLTKMPFEKTFKSVY